MLHLIIGKDWIVNQQTVLARIARDVRERKPGRILMVPELISHETERALCQTAGDTASRYAEVLSFTRLARRAAEQAGSGAMECLDNGGRVVAMAAAARQLSSRLKAYAAVETKPEFLLELIDAVDEFKRCCISADDLRRAAEETEGSLSQKLEELALLMESYDSLCSRGKRDPRDQMTWLLEQLEDGSFAEEHVFYIDGFPDFTRQHMAILEHLIRSSPDVTVSLNCDAVDSGLMAFEKAGGTAGQLLRSAQRLGVPVKVEVLPEREDALQAVRNRLYQGNIFFGCAQPALQTFRADSPWAEVMSAARRVRELVSSGCRYRDITLVCTDMPQYQPLVNLIFRRMQIPVYQSGTEEILQKSMIATVLTALDAALSDFDQRNVFRYLRSALSGMDLDTCDLVENYAFLWGIRGSHWTQPWENHPDGLGETWTTEAEERLSALNRAREQYIGPLEQLRRGFREAVSLRDQVLALYAFLETIRLEKRLTDLAAELDDGGSNRESQILNQLWEILLSALEQMHDVLGDTHWEPEHFVRLLRLLLSQYDVGTIPPVLDAVQMGPVTAMRCHSQKHLILVGAQEGSLPAYSGSAGVLTDQERVALRALGVPLTGGAMEGVQAEFAEIYGVFCGAVETMRVYCSGQPSFVYRRLTELAGGEETADASLGFADADAQEAAAYLAEWEQEQAAASLDLLDAYTRVRSQADYKIGSVTPENIRRLYGENLNLSASQVDKQAECRLSYFLNYGLRAKERKEAAVDPAEFGTYVHAVLENTAREIRNMGGFHQITLADTLEIAHRYSESYAQERFGQIQSERMVYLFRRNLRELDMVVEELWRELSESEFEPRDFEVAFGAAEGQSLPPISIPNGKMPAILRGFVDRVDVWQSPGSLYYRVVDYKTGKKDFDYCDVFNGVGLQMLLYLFALQSSGTELLGAHPVAAGVQYFPARVPYETYDGKPEPEELEKKRSGNWERKGLLLKDEAVLHAMEPGDGPKRLSYSVTKDGSITGNVADRDQLRLLEKYVFRVLGGLVEDIASGNVEPNPYTRGSSHDACRFCPYGTVCHSGSVAGRRNYKMMNAQRFWEEVEKEMEKHGR